MNRAHGCRWNKVQGSDDGIDGGVRLWKEGREGRRGGCRGEREVAEVRGIGR